MRWLLSGFVGIVLLSCGTRTVFAQAATAVESSVALAARNSVPGTGPSSGFSSSPALQLKQTVPAREIIPRDSVRLELALGRLQLNGSNFRIVKKHEAFDEDQCERSYQVSTFNGRPSVRVLYRDAIENWTLAMDGNSHCEWRREFHVEGNAVSIDYRQTDRMPIEIEVRETGKAPHRLRSHSLWHLTSEADPVFCKFVLPSLVRLNSSWDLPATLACAKRQMTLMLAKKADEEANAVTARKSSDAVSNSELTHHVARCLKDLEASEHARRKSAEKELKNLGIAGYIPLCEAFQGRLTPHQKQVVDELLDSLQPHSADNATRIAYWLSGDPNWR